MLHDYARMSPDELQAHAHRRLNVGCGQWPLHYFTNLDADPSAIADVYQSVPPLPFADGALHDIYAGHFLEHLTPAEATAFLLECRRCLAPGGRLGIVVPDTREIMTRWLSGAIDAVEFPNGRFHDVADLDAVCGLFLYSSVQDSPHKWSYDIFTLGRLLTSVGFTVTGEIDRYRDPRVTHGAWYGFGLDAIAPGLGQEIQ
jgi:predicted SAM-dependent methyltransferase